MSREYWRSYFEFSPFDNNRTNGLCRLCNRNYKDRNGIYSNFLKHLKRMHSVEYDRIFNHENEYLSDEKSKTDFNEAASNLTNAKYRENRILLSIVKNLIIRCNLPFHIVENQAFRDFMKECNFKYEPVSAKRLKNDLVPSFTSKVLQRIHETLNDVDYVTLTVDAWSDRRCRSFLGITCHFIDQRMMPQAYLIDFLRLKCPHTGETIQRLTEEVIERFNIKSKVFKIITDNASSMIKAYKFGLCVDADEDSTADQTESVVHGESTYDAFEQDIQYHDFQILNVDLDGLNRVKDSKPTRLSCFAHTIQLCVRDGLKNASYMSRVFEKCQQLQKSSSHSSKIADLLDELHTHLHKIAITRWNSEYMLIKSILSIKRTDLESIIKLMDNPITFLNDDLTILDEIVRILEPFNEISIKCQAATIVTVSLIVPAIVHLISHLQDIKGKVLFCISLIEKLQVSIEKRFSGIIHRLNLVEVEKNDPFNDPLYFMAAVLDPSFKFYWIRDLKLPANIENRLKQNVIQLILDEIIKEVPFQSQSQSHDELSSYSFTSTLASSFSTTNSATVPSSSAPNVKKRRFYVYNNTNNEETCKLTLDPATELETYLNDPIRSKFSEYWFHSRLHLLKKLVMRIFSVQASSAPIERVFSHAGLILSSRRTNMNEQLFRDLVFLKVNQGLL